MTMSPASDSGEPVPDPLQREDDARRRALGALDRLEVKLALGVPSPDTDKALS